MKTIYTHNTISIKLWRSNESDNTRNTGFVILEILMLKRFSRFFKLPLIFATRLGVATRVLVKSGRDSSRLGLRRPGGISDARVIRMRGIRKYRREIPAKTDYNSWHNRMPPRFGLRASSSIIECIGRARDYVIINHPCIVYAARPSPIINSRCVP